MPLSAATPRTRGMSGWCGTGNVGAAAGSPNAWKNRSPPPGVLRSFFADLGRQRDLVSALEAARADAITAQLELATMAQSSVDGSAPFPERIAMGALTMRFVADFHRLVEEWTTWAAREVATWEHADGREWKGARKVMSDIANSTQ
ncbi:MAG TPA: hypothetical protein VFV00_08480 [Acidimicrobiales bacterium]|nr:hypothetical protein [Acidimicrobiales bacterium]